MGFFLRETRSRNVELLKWCFHSYSSMAHCAQWAETENAKTFQIANLDAQNLSGQQMATPRLFRLPRVTVYLLFPSLSRVSENFQEVPETFHSVRKLSRVSRKFSRVSGKFFRVSVNFSKCPETLQSV